MRRLGRHWVPAWPSRCVLGLWLGLSLVIGVTAIAWVIPLPDGSMRVPAGAAQFLGPLAIFIVGLVLIRQASRSWLVVLGMVALLWATLAIGLGCPGRTCPTPPEYEHSRNIEMALDFGLGGPRLLLSSDIEPCAFDCPYTIHLFPLTFGYLAYADALTTADS